MMDKKDDDIKTSAEVEDSTDGKSSAGIVTQDETEGVTRNEDYHQSEENHNSHLMPDPKFIENFTNGLLQNMLPDLETAKVSLNEGLKNQDILIETVQQENAKFAECNSLTQLLEMMNGAKIYHNKLLSVKKDMIVLTDKTSKLKKRAVKLQQQKQREEQYLIQQREKEIEREQKLMARVAKPGDSSKPNI